MELMGRSDLNAMATAAKAWPSSNGRMAVASFI